MAFLKLAHIQLRTMKKGILLLVCLVLGLLGAWKLDLVYQRVLPDDIFLMVVDKDNSQASKKFQEYLIENAGLELKTVPSFSTELLTNESYQGVLVIEKNFGENLPYQKKLGSLYYTAGIKDNTAIYELVMSTIIQMKSKISYQVASQKYLKEAEQPNTGIQDLFVLEYKDTSGALVKASESAKPVTSQLNLALGSVFFICSFLFAKTYLPDSSTRRLRFYGRKNLLKQQLIGIGLLSYLFILAVLVASVVGVLIFPIQFDKNATILLLGVAEYGLCLGWLFINASLKSKMEWLFIPWLLLNMTLGGGLWGVTEVQRWSSLFLPTALVIEQNIMLLWLLATVFGICSVAAILKKQQH